MIARPLIRFSLFLCYCIYNRTKNQITKNNNKLLVYLQKSIVLKLIWNTDIIKMFGLFHLTWRHYMLTAKSNFTWIVQTERARSFIPEQSIHEDMESVNELPIISRSNTNENILSLCVCFFVWKKFISFEWIAQSADTHPDQIEFILYMHIYSRSQCDKIKPTR